MDLVSVARGHVYDASIYGRECQLRRQACCFTQDAFPAQFMRMVLWKKTDIGGVYKTMDYVLGVRCLIGQVDGDLSARTRSLGMITFEMSLPLTQRRTGSREDLTLDHTTVGLVGRGEVSPRSRGMRPAAVALIAVWQSCFCRLGLHPGKAYLEWIDLSSLGG